jgi:hypothetical protein
LLLTSLQKSSSPLWYSSGRILGTFACALTPDSKPFPLAHFFMAVSLLGDYSAIPLGSLYLPVIIQAFPQL